MNRFISKTKEFIFLRQKSIFSSAILLALMIVISRFFGFFRFRILSGYFSKEQLDIFFASFRIPDLVFEILISGALTSTFIPIFIKYQENKKELDVVISSIINLLFLTMTACIVILFIFADFFIPLITLGYSKEKIAIIIFFSRILLLGQLPFLIFGNILTGIGQAHKTFFLSAIAPIVYNIAIIIFTLAFATSLGLSAPIFGVVVGAFLFFLIQLPLLKRTNFSFHLLIKKTAGLIQFIRMIIPRAFTVIIGQIDATIDLTLTTLMGAGSYTVFYFAQHLQLLPVSVIGIAFGQASLPYLSQVFQEKRIEEFKKIIVQSILNVSFFTIPIASFFIFARTPLVRLFFGGQKFDWQATVATAITLSYFSVALPFHSLYYFLTRCFYASLDTRTPFFISIISIVINTLLSLYFVLIAKSPVWVLAGAFAFSMLLNVGLLYFLLEKRLGALDSRYLTVESFKMLLATIVSSFATYYLMKLLDGLIFDTSYTLNVFLLLLTGGLVFFLLYLFLCWIIDVKEIYLVSKLLLKAREYQRRILEFYTSYE